MSQVPPPLPPPIIPLPIPLQYPPQVLPYAGAGQGLGGAARYIPAKGRGVATFIVVTMATVLQPVAIWALCGQINLLRRIKFKQPYTLAEAHWNDHLVDGVQLAILMLMLTGMVLWLVWVSRAYRNLPALTGHAAKLSPGSAVGGFLVPFLNFVRIPQVMIELWNESDPAGETDRMTVIVWWIFWLGGGIVGRVASVMKDTSAGAVGSANFLDSLISMTYVYIGYHTMLLTTGLMALWIIWKIDDRQTRKARLMGLA
jgi:hypothetical protein